MLRRLSASAVLAAVLLAVTAVPASAAEPAPAAPLTLSSYTVGVGAPPATAVTVPSAPNCTFQRLYCGAVVVTASFAGLGDGTRPFSYGPNAYLGGTVDVTRTYGCQNPGGKIVHRFDRTVTETRTLIPRAFGGFSIPETGDTLEATVYAFLPDSQPGNCPKNFTPVNTSIVASGAKLTLTSYGRFFADGTYDAPRTGSWYGVAPTPISGYATS